MTLRAKWLESQRDWHQHRRAEEFGKYVHATHPVHRVKILAVRKWHVSQANWYSAQLAALCLNGGKDH